MKKTIRYFKLIAAIVMLFNLTACEELLKTLEELQEETEQETDKDKEEEVEDKSTGLDKDEEERVYSTIPEDLSLVIFDDANIENENQAGLYDFIPPVKSQGQYGTCTSWATGYYTRTIMYAHENDLSTSDLEDDQNVFSPLDIYLSISHGSNCGGSSIAEAFSTMQSRGIARMADVPYENLGDCSQNSHATPSQYTPGKINHYRRVDISSVEGLKTYIQKGMPIAVGCKLAPDFMTYSDGVIEDLDYSEWDAQGKHSYHAMCVVGYDNNKGPGGAFCIVNSWGKNWGEDGYVWVDYDFFTNGVFCQYGYVIESDKGVEPIIDKNVVDPNVRVSGKDLLTIYLEDRPGDVTDYKPNPGPRDRSVQYNVFNKGSQTIPASDDWNIIYYYYNAYKPQEDFGIIFYDYYTDDVKDVAQKGENGNITDLSIDLMTYGNWNWWNYVDVPAGFSVGKAVDNMQESDMVFDYELPSSLDGEYYFVMFADGFNALDEKHEQNNFMFFTGKDKAPVRIENGVILQSSLKSGEKPTVYINELRSEQPNAYSIDEIANLVSHQKQNGILQAAAESFRKKLKSGSLKQTQKRFVPASR